jgi:hypothetical protein
MHQLLSMWDFQNTEREPYSVKPGHACCYPLEGPRPLRRFLIQDNGIIRFGVISIRSIPQGRKQ